MLAVKMKKMEFCAEIGIGDFIPIQHPTSALSQDTYSRAKENITKGKPVMIKLEGEEEEEEHHKEVRGKGKRKLPQFLEQYFIESDDDKEEGRGSTQDNCSMEDNVFPYPLIVKIETPEDFNAPESQQRLQLNTTHNKSSSSVHSSLQHDSQLQVGGSSSSTVSVFTGQTITNEKLIAWMAEIADKVKQVDNKIDLVLKNQEKLLLLNQQVPEGIERKEDLEILGNLPVSNDCSFVELNKKLSEDSHLRRLLVKVLISVGGKDMRCHIYNMLRRVLSDEVAELYTISGKSTLKNAIKKPFFATEVSKSVFSACQKVFKDMAIEVKMKEAVGDWLNQAKSRKIRRMERHEKNIAKSME